MNAVPIKFTPNMVGAYENVDTLIHLFLYILKNTLKRKTTNISFFIATQSVCIEISFTPFATWFVLIKMSVFLTKFIPLALNKHLIKLYIGNRSTWLFFMNGCSYKIFTQHGLLLTTGSAILIRI